MVGVAVGAVEQADMRIAASSATPAPGRRARGSLNLLWVIVLSPMIAVCGLGWPGRSAIRRGGPGLPIEGRSPVPATICHILFFLAMGRVTVG